MRIALRQPEDLKQFCFRKISSVEKLYLLIVSICLLFPGILTAQEDPIEIGGIINQYSKVTRIDTDCDYVEVVNSNIFSRGDKVLLIQMQGVRINETNTAAFGDIEDYQSAGNYEYADILYISGSNIYFKKKILRDYDTGASVQLVRTPVYDNAIVTSELICPAWDGNTGGIISLIVRGTIELRAKINSSGRGFRGGRLVNFQSFECSYFDYAASFNQGIGGQKGEGIAQYIVGKDYARGKNANGGGGGNVHNTGGGGGSNGGAGGLGGSEWSGCSLQSVNVGAGGQKIDFNQGDQKIFLGGGGGGGNQDNDVATEGVPGGGMIIFQFDKLIANMQSIEASGQSQTLDAGIDSGGGGGGGGTVLLSGNEIVGNLIVNIAGGSGGSINDNRYGLSNQWGPGGGGGGGLLWLSDELLSSFVNLNFAGGKAGITPLNNNWGATDGEPGLRLSGLKIPEGPPKEDVFAETTLTFCKNDPVKILQLDCNGPTSWIVPYSDSIFVSEELTITNLDTAIQIIGICGDLFCPDSIVVFNIEINDQVITTDVVEDICKGEVFVYNGETLSSSGIYPFTLSSDTGCDSIVIIQLTVHETYTTLINDTICRGSQYLFQGEYLDSEGLYETILQTDMGCDSLVTLDLHVTEAPESEIFATICVGSEYSFNNINYSQSGIYAATFQDLKGCDSLVTLHLEIASEIEVNLSASICQGESYTFGDQTLTTAGRYIIDLTNPFGCDSITNLDLIVNTAYHEYIDTVICKGQIYTLNGNQYDTQGIYIDSMQTTFGCDSIFSLSLKVSAPEPELGPDRDFCPERDTIYLFPGNFTSYLWNDGVSSSQIEAKSGGLYSVRVTDQFGCIAIDSITLLDYCELQFFIPDAFSPNLDGINDWFQVYFSHMPESFELHIYDRWGERIAFITDPVKGWDGRFKGKDVPTAVYVWLVKIDGKTYSGDVFLYR